MRTYALTLMVLALLCGCNLDWIPGVQRPDTPTQGGGGQTGDQTTSALLKTFQSENELKQYFASLARNGFWDDAVDNATPLFDTDGDRGNAGVPGTETALEDGWDSGPKGGGGTTPDFSDTTTQEEGVQEADVLKNDSTYLYVLTAGHLRIVQAAPGEQMQELAAVEIQGWGRELYKLPANANVATRIVAITQLDHWFGHGVVRVDADEVAAAQVDIGIVPPWFSSPETLITVLDVSDHAHPVVLSRTTLDGSLGSSRMIEDRLYLALFNYPDYYGGFRFDEVEQMDLTSLMPDYTVELADGTSSRGDLLNWDTIYRPSDPNGLGLTSIVTIDVSNPTALTAVGVMAYPGNLYASQEAIYLTNTIYDYSTGDWRESTSIYKFAVGRTGASLTATGTVPGGVLNQYSMSEYAGYLRAATTTGPSWLPDDQRPSTNSVYVLAQQGELLQIIGRLEGLAPGEQIMSARFLGTRGFLVTFEQVDPLFTFDLSDPANPVKVGEWHGPGFSTFITPLGENHLLTIGQSVDTQSDWARSNGVQLSVFDVTDFAAPQLVHQRIIGSYGTWSECLYNPKALTHFPARHLLAVPITDWGWEEWDVDGDSDVSAKDPIAADPLPPGSGKVGASQAEPDLTGSFDGVYIYQVTAESGFEYLGRMTTRTEELTDWWYFSSFTRGVFLGDNVYIVTEHGVVGAPITAIDTTPWRVSFPLEELYPDGFDWLEPLPPKETEGSASESRDGGDPMENL